ncbi:TPA: fimbrial protein [Salmonella enterica subsp. enterica serovar Muenchen]
MKTRIKKTLLVLIECSSMFCIQSAIALDIPIKITGEVYIPPCKIKNDEDFNVSFGKIALQKVDGRNYARPTTVKVNCEYFQGKPYIHLSGGTGQLLGAPDNVLQTKGVNSSILGIALYQGGAVDSSSPLRIGAGEQGIYGYEITKGISTLNVQNSQFTFTAVPYKLGSLDLEAGIFNASVTISISYR